MRKKKIKVATGLFAALQAGSAMGQSSAQVDQIQVPASSDGPSVAAPQVPVAKPTRSATVNQLPRYLEPLSDDDVPEAPAPSTATRDSRVRDDIARAIQTIRDRGQQPTPELIAREIGPEAITAFLNDNPDKAGVLVGTEDPRSQAPDNTTITPTPE
jgi:hypothetical protein